MFPYPGIADQKILAVWARCLFIVFDKQVPTVWSPVLGRVPIIGHVSLFCINC